MDIFRKRHIRVLSLVVVSVIVAGCGVDYAIPEEYLSDGELLSRSMDDTASKFISTPILVSGGPYVLSNLDAEDETYTLLYSRFEDALSGSLSEGEIGVAGAGDETAVDETGGDQIQYRMLECRIVNEKTSRGKVKRVGRTVAHIRVFQSDEMVWAGEVTGTYENEVPKSVLEKLTDERITQIGPQAPEKGKNPFIEPLLVTGITGALIYLFAVSAK